MLNKIKVYTYTYIYLDALYLFIFYVQFIIYFFWPYCIACRNLVPNQALNPDPLYG